MAALAAENAPDAANTLDEYRDQAVRIGAALTDISSDIRVVRLLLIDAASVDTDQRAVPRSGTWRSPDTPESTSIVTSESRNRRHMRV